MAFKSKAEQMFEEKVQIAIDRRDWDLLAEVGQQYEAYLKLVEPIENLPVKQEYYLTIE